MTTMPTAHGEFDGAAAAYALGALDPPEKQAFEAHLATCAACQAELRDMQRVVVGIGQATAVVAPPEGLKARVLANAMAQEQRSAVPRSADARSAPLRRDPRQSGAGSGSPWNTLAIAASIVLAVGAGIYAWSLRTQVQSLRQTVTEASSQIAALRADLATARRDAATLKTTIRVLSAPDLIQVNLKGQTPAPNAIARGFWSRSYGIIFQTDGLPGLDLSKVYQLWVIKDGKPGSLGTFRVDASGAGVFTVDPSLVPEPPQTLAVSLERAGGVPAPEGPIVLMGSSQK